MPKEVYSFILSEENAWKATFVPLTASSRWNMRQHIERCMCIVGGKFFLGRNDVLGERPYDDISTPIIDVAFRLEGFDVKDIVPYVDDVEENYKSFLVKKFHPQWARKNQLDTFIDEVVESSVIYDLVLVKNINQTRPEVVPLQDIAFCDQTDAMAGPICIKHKYTIPELLKFKNKWDKAKIDEAIVHSMKQKKVMPAHDQYALTPTKYVEVYELHGSFPETWLDPAGDATNYIPQMHIVSFYGDNTDKDGLTLYAGKEGEMDTVFKALKIDNVRSRGRACGRSIVERLFEPQVWANYDGIKLKKMLDGAVNLLQTDSDEYGNKRISELKEQTIIKHETGRPITKIDMGLQNFQAVQAHATSMQTSAMMLGSASESALGRTAPAGTPFALQQAIIQQGAGIHTYRRGKIATFFSDVLYPDWILPNLVKEMNGGKTFSEELNLDEMHQIGDQIATQYANKQLVAMVINGQTPTPQIQQLLTETVKKTWMKGGNRKFFETLKGDLADIPVKVFINIAGNERDLSANADKLSNLILTLLKVGVPLVSLSKPLNELLEDSGFSSVDFSQIDKAASVPPQQPSPPQPNQPVPSPMSPVPSPLPNNQQQPK